MEILNELRKAYRSCDDPLFDKSIEQVEWAMAVNSALDASNKKLIALNAKLLAACKEAVAEFDTGWFAQGKSIIVAAIENMEGK